MSSLKPPEPRKPPARQEGSWVSYITSPQAGSVLSAQSREGWGVGRRELVSGRSPSGPYFTDTPDRACCQERCLISSPDGWPGSPQQRGALCPPPHPWHLLRRDPPGTHRGDLGDEGASCAAAP